jgi:thiol-disulfide isomerase/thioredoxin
MPPPPVLVKEKIMAFLTAAVVLVGVLVLLDLLLTLGLVKRVRTHAGLLGQLAAQPATPAPDPGLLAVGSSVGDFAGVTTDGAEVARSTFPDGAVIGFFSTWCDACEEHLPGFLSYAEPLGRDRVLAVVQGDQEALADLTGKLSKVARVVTEPDQGPIARAAGVRALPTMAVVDADWRVTSSGYSADMLVPAT